MVDVLQGPDDGLVRLQQGIPLAVNLAVQQRGHPIHDFRDGAVFQRQPFPERGMAFVDDVDVVLQADQSLSVQVQKQPLVIAVAQKGLDFHQQVIPWDVCMFRQVHINERRFQQKMIDIHMTGIDVGMDDVGRNHEDIALLGRELILLNQMEAAAGQDDIDFIEFMPVGLDGIIRVEESPGQGDSSGKLLFRSQWNWLSIFMVALLLETFVHLFEYYILLLYHVYP